MSAMMTVNCYYDYYCDLNVIIINMQTSEYILAQIHVYIYTHTHNSFLDLLVFSRGGALLW